MSSDLNKIREVKVKFPKKVRDYINILIILSFKEEKCSKGQNKRKGKGGSHRKFTHKDYPDLIENIARPDGDRMLPEMRSHLRKFIKEINKRDNERKDKTVRAQEVLSWTNIPK